MSAEPKSWQARGARAVPGQVVGRAASRLNKMETGFLTRGIKGRTSWRAWRGAEQSKACASSPRVWPKASRTALSALPSSFAGTALNDKTWEGNPLLNLVAGTYEGVKGARADGRRHAGWHGVTRCVQARRLRTCTARRRRKDGSPRPIASSTRRLSNIALTTRDATYQDFLNPPRLIARRPKSNQRGLIGEQRQLAQAR